MNKFSVFRYAIRTALSVVISGILSEVLFQGGAAWAILAAYFINQPAEHAPIRHRLVFIMMMLSAILISYVVDDYFNVSIVLFITAAILFSAMQYIYFIRGNRRISIIYPATLFLISLLIAAHFSSTMTIKVDFLGVIMGSLIAIVCEKLIWPVNISDAFKLGIIPTLDVIKEYSQTIHYVLYEKMKQENVEALYEANIMLEKMLTAEQSVYPEWIYAPGFNPGLRSGLRYFVIHLEWIIEALLAVAYLIKQPIETVLLDPLLPFLSNAIQKNNELIALLADCLTNNQIKELTSDYTSDITALETALRDVIPTQLEILDISPQYVTLAAIVREVKDLRTMLLQLVMTVQV